MHNWLGVVKCKYIAKRCSFILGLLIAKWQNLTNRFASKIANSSISATPFVLLAPLRALYVTMRQHWSSIAPRFLDFQSAQRHSVTTLTLNRYYFMKLRAPDRAKKRDIVGALVACQESLLGQKTVLNLSSCNGSKRIKMVWFGKYGEKFTFEKMTSPWHRKSNSFGKSSGCTIVHFTRFISFCRFMQEFGKLSKPRLNT